ncbi:MAG: DUF4055 domain-containing protein [Planctomycetota bacterium]
MPVTTPHPQYKEYADKWRKCRDVIAGEEAVKDAGTTYLPRLEGQEDDDYWAYVKRACFFGATKRTREGLVGAILRREPRVVAPDSLVELLGDVGHRRESLREIIRSVLEETLDVGRVGILADAPDVENADPYVALYHAENIISWRESDVGGRRQLTRVVLREPYLEEDPKDPFALKSRERFRVLMLDTEGEVPLYRVEVWVPKDPESKAKDQEMVLAEEYVPRRKGGSTFDQIPFVIVGAGGTDPCVDDPPLLEVVNVNLAHYRGSADLELGRHWTAIPTPYVANGEVKDVLTVGGAEAWIIPGENVRVGYLEFTGAGLNHLARGQEDKERQMSVLGARLLESPRPGVEAAETVRLRQSGEQSVLSKIAQSVSDGLTMALQWVASWVNPNQDAEVMVELSTDFEALGITPQMFATLLAAESAQQISWQVMHHNLRRGELIPDDIDMETEAELIAAGRPGGEGGLRRSEGDDDE